LADPQLPLTTAVQVAPDWLQVPWLQLVVTEPVQPAAVLERLPEKPWLWAERAAEQLDQLEVVAAQLRLDEQLAVVPPKAPVHCHVYGPVPPTVVGVPAPHRLALGAEAVLWPSADPQLPLTTALQEAPVWLQVPWLQLVVTEPLQPAAVLERLAEKPWLWAERAAEQLDQLEVVAAQLRFDEQLAVVPPKAPVHCHVYGPVPPTVVGVPAPHRLALGADAVL
jgi:hypothetical protein